jgi:trimethylamine:corrinoid methyltransferase-like protein
LDLNYYEKFEFPGNFLKEKLTRQLYRDEFYLPSPVIDRGSLREWKENQSLGTFERAKAEAERLITSFQHPELDNSMVQEMTELVASHARQAGMDRLPAIN